MENDINDFKKLSESFNYQRLDEEDRTVLGGHAQTLQVQHAQKSEELKRILSQLGAAKFWSTHSHRRAPTSAEDAARQQELLGHLHTLSGSVSHLQELLRTVDVRWEQVFQRLQANRNAGDANTFLAEAIVPPELEKINESLAAFDGRLSSLEYDITQQSQGYLQELDAIVAENMQALALASSGTVQARPPEPRAALSDEQLQTLKMLQENAATTGQQVTRLSQEMKDLATRNDGLQTENMQLQAECAQLRQQLEEVRSRIHAHPSLTCVRYP